MNSNVKDSEASRYYDIEGQLPTDFNGDRNFAPGEVWMATN